MPDPLISVILPTKNSMPHLKRAITALQSQSYKKFEVIVQDGDSTDGTLDYLATVKNLPKLSIFSEKDSGIGQAYGRGIKRSEGNLIYNAASDEYLFPYSLELGINWFKQHPEAGAIYGAFAQIDSADKVLAIVTPEPFDLIQFMHFQQCPTNAGLLNRAVLDGELYWDEQLITCPDYDFWLRAGSRFGQDRLIARPEPFHAARADRTSTSFRIEQYEQFCKDKCFVLDRFLDRQAPSHLIEEIRRSAKAGIYLAATKMVLSIEGASDLALKLFTEAAKYHANNPIFQQVSKAFSVKQISQAKKIVPAIPSPSEPPPNATIAFSVFEPKNIITWPAWGSSLKKTDFVNLRVVKCKGNLAKMANALLALIRPYQNKYRNTTTYLIQGGELPWCYSAEIKSNPNFSPAPHSSYWLKIRFKVLQGRIGIYLQNGDNITSINYFDKTGSGDVCYTVAITCFDDLSCIIGNAGEAHSAVELYEVAAVFSDNFTELLTR